MKGMTAFIDRSLCQTRDGLVFKSTKTEEPRKVELPPSMVACLKVHRLRQDEFRRQFGADARRTDNQASPGGPDVQERTAGWATAPHRF